MKKVSQAITLIFLGFHLSFIIYCNILSLAHFDEYRSNLSEKSNEFIKTVKLAERKVPNLYKLVFDFYKNYSGITGYVFFSPDPPDSYRFYFTYESNGQSFIEELPMKSFEGNLRKLCGYDFLKEIKNNDYQDLIARSIASRFFELHPSLNQITLTTVYYRLPSARKYSTGQKPKFERHLRFEFKLN